MDFLGAEDILALDAPPADRRYDYGDHESQFVNLRLPSGEGPYPVVAILHGGCWVKAFASLGYFAPVAEKLRQSGYAVWNIEYRRVDEKGGGWPGTFQDVGMGMDLLREAGEEYPLDTGKVVVIGHSAGGHLALWAAGRAKIPAGTPLSAPDPIAVQGAVSIAGPGDLEAAREHMAEPCGGDHIIALMDGTGGEAPDNYAIGSPVNLLPLGVRQIMLTGDHDDIVPVRFAKAYVEKAQAAGDRAEHRIIENAAHHEIGAPDSVAWPVLKAAIEDLMAAGR